MTLIPKDMTPVYKATIAKGTSPTRWQRPIYVDLLPPCNNACPAGLNIQAWLELAQDGRYHDAWLRYMEENPFPGTHGRACYHPCESACNRQFLDQPIAVHALDRFLGDLAIEHGWTVLVKPPTGRRVLVIGAGPAGLTCAYHLRRMGHNVEIRDAGADPGGMMRYGIPAYRLPRDGLTSEVERIRAMGVKMTPNHRVTDVIGEKEAGGFDAVFLAVGAHIGNHLDIPSMDGAKMIHALSLLEDVEHGTPPQLGRVVGIIGGGNTAVDVARVARRLGAEEAILIYRSDRAHMRAHPHEAREAFAEGVKVKWMSTVTQFGTDELLVEEMEMAPDGKGTVSTGRFHQLQANSLVLAVGEHADLEFLKPVSGVRIGRGDVVEVDVQMSTGYPGLFAGGDMIGGARTMTAAVGHGKKAARSIDAWLRRETYQKPPKHPLIPFEALNLPVFLDAERREQQELPAEKRFGFEEVVAGLSEREARFEAARCLSCGNCFECDNCYAACPEQAIVKLGKGRFYRYDYDLCTGCAVCFEQCPCHAIEMIPETEAAAEICAAPEVQDTSLIVYEGKTMSSARSAVMDGNTAAAHIAYRVNEVCAIFPITPSSAMAELADAWTAEGVTNIWGNIPVVTQMQSEGGAAGTLHGSLQSGALTTTFTASQGLLLMLPNMYKIAGELTPCVFHVAARALATQALSIFGDHSDVMSARMTGFAMLAAASVQEAHDLALVAQAVTLESRVPIMYFFDGFRTSHEENKISIIPDEQIRLMIDDELVRAFRARALSPEHPVVRGTAHNPDTFFQARETVNPFYERFPAIVQKTMDRLAALTGRPYGLFHYSGDPAAERVAVAIGSACEVLDETAAYLNARGEKLGVLQVTLYRPWAPEAFLAALPRSVQSIAVLDRTKEVGANDPLYADVLTTFAQALGSGAWPAMPRIIAGRYGISSKDFDASMAKSVFDELRKPQPKQRFTVGINDDVSHSSLAFDPDFSIEPPDVVRALFFGLGADGTIGANKNSVKILAADPNRYAQGYFVYDSKKSGSYTISHLRFGSRPIRAPYLLKSANFVGVHKFDFLFKQDVLTPAARGATVLLNSPYGPERVWTELPNRVQQQILDKELKLFVIDASSVASRLGLGSRSNTILQTCFFALSGVLPRDEAIAAIKKETERTYERKGAEVVRKNFAAIDSALANLHPVTPGAPQTGQPEFVVKVPDSAPEFVRKVTTVMMAGLGETLPVSALPVDGTFPTGTTQYEKRNIADEVPIWEPDICIQCGQCSIVCPHSVIRAKYYDSTRLENAPTNFKAVPINARGYPESRYTLQVYVEDCTGCGVCVENCPAHAPHDASIKAINMRSRLQHLDEERTSIGFFETLPWPDRTRVNFSNVRGVQFMEPLFEFPGACAGCGETPYLKLLSQLFGDRLQIANATGCSSIYGGNLPTTPWASNAEGRGPAWANSLFEDNAEFGLGYRIAVDKQTELARALTSRLASRLGEDLVDALLAAPQLTESDFRLQRERLSALKAKLAPMQDEEAKNLAAIADFLVRRSVWSVGGDGWAYDIGYGGLDHVLASGRDVNVLVLDTGCYSNTGGQASKATPLGASAKFDAAGRKVPRKDLAMMAIAYGNVYVAQVAMGANNEHAVIAFREAEAHPGPSLILAYSQCIAHGINMRHGMKQAARAVASGQWPLLRFDPSMRQRDMNPFRLDSTRPRIALEDYRYREVRYKVLQQTHPNEARKMMRQAELSLAERYKLYEDLAARDGTRFHPHWEDV